MYGETTTPSNIAYSKDEKRGASEKTSITRRPIQIFPQKSEHLHRVYFAPNGEPTQELMSKVERVRASLKRQGIEDARIYVVGATVALDDNSSYTGDLDLYIHAPEVAKQLPSNFVKQTIRTGGEDTIAWKTSNEVNKTLPTTPEGAKSPDYIDIMVAPHPPYEDWPFSEGQQKFYYEPELNQWYSAELPITQL